MDTELLAMKNEKRTLTYIALALLVIAIGMGVNDAAGIALVALLGCVGCVGARIQTGRLAARVEQALDGAKFASTRA